MLIRKVSKNKAEEFVRLYKSGLSTLSIARLYGISPTAVQYHLHSRQVALRAAHTYPRPAPRELPLTISLAYILGVAGPGDGYLLYNTAGKYRIGLRTVDQEFADKFSSELAVISGIKPIKRIETTRHKPVYTIMLHSKFICEAMLRYVSTPNDFKEICWKIPEAILAAPASFKCAYLRGFADSQGCVYQNGPVRHIFLSSKNAPGLRQMQQLLLSVGIYSSIRKDNTALRLSGYHNLRRFNEIVGFTILHRQQKLRNLLEGYKSIKRPRTPSVNVQAMLPQLSVLRKQGLTYRELELKSGIDLTTIAKRLKPFAGGSQ